MHGTTIHISSSGPSTVLKEQGKSSNVQAELGLVDYYRSHCMACGRPVNPAHGICDCGIQNAKPGDVKGNNEK
ncbi:hypothetical protein TWF506_004457 [Arthrobotrys conoides]|uniref:Uncharacterized protein n=1 Tax=Arthrobotrys conoides TaxID=74498 RepID=A0AAN8RPJ7_9PEZI